MWISLSVDFTVNGLQLVVPEDECEEFGSGTQAQRWRPLQAIVAQVQVCQFTQGLRGSNEEMRHSQRQNKVLSPAGKYFFN